MRNLEQTETLLKELTNNFRALTGSTDRDFQDSPDYIRLSFTIEVDGAHVSKQALVKQLEPSGKLRLLVWKETPLNWCHAFDTFKPEDIRKAFKAQLPTKKPV